MNSGLFESFSYNFISNIDMQIRVTSCNLEGSCSTDDYHETIAKQRSRRQWTINET